MLEAFEEYVKTERVNSNIIHINYNLPEYDNLLEYRSLYDYINSRYMKGKQNSL